MSTRELAEYAADQLSDLSGIRYIPMMGGYIFYINERIFGGIYGDGFMVKITNASSAALPDAVPAPPYEGAKNMLPALNLDDRQAFSAMVAAMEPELPVQKPRKGRKKS